MRRILLCRSLGGLVFRAAFSFVAGDNGFPVFNQADFCFIADIRVKPGAGVSVDELSADKPISIQFTTPDF
jgi:hypothetical protein